MSKLPREKIFPRFIDFGTLEVGTAETLKFPLTSTVPLNFEYEFEFKTKHPDILIYPMKGIIPGLG